MKQVSPTKVSVNFECLDCKKTSQCSISELAETGAPYCIMCEEIMDLVDCEIDTTED